MTAILPLKLEQFNTQCYFFIAHLYDRVLVGTTLDTEQEQTGHYEELQKALKQNLVLEVHFFNHDEEVYAAQKGGKLVVYEPLRHNTDEQAEVITRSYVIESQYSSLYKTLVIKEYIDYEDNLAYVKQTILYELRKEDLAI
ncbi:hypothetical protein D3C76_313250 [compost metagenome]